MGRGGSRGGRAGAAPAGRPCGAEAGGLRPSSGVAGAESARRGRRLRRRRPAGRGCRRFRRLRVLPALRRASSRSALGGDEVPALAPVNLAEQPLASSFVFEAVGQRDQQAGEVAVFVEAVVGRGGVVDQVDEAVEALRFLGAGEEFGQLRRRAGAGLGQVAGVLRTTGSAARRVGPASSPVAPSDFSETVEAAENGVSRRVASVNEGAALPSVGEGRRGRVGEALQAAHRRAELAQEGGELLQRGFQVRAAFGARLGGGAGVGEEAGDAGRVRARAARGSARSRRRAGSAGRAGALRMPSSRSTSRSAGLARLTAASMSAPRPARPAPSSLKIRRKRCA